MLNKSKHSVFNLFFLLLSIAIINTSCNEVKKEEEAKVSQNSDSEEVIVPPQSRSLGVPININSLITNERLDWTSGGVPQKQTKSYCEDRKNSFYGRYNIIDKEKQDPSIAGYIDIGAIGKFGDWNKADDNQIIHGVYLDTDVIKVWNSLVVGMSRYDLNQFLIQHDSQLMVLENNKSKSFFILNDYYGFIEFSGNTVIKIELKGKC